jgi:large subunit ribosomal protein L1
MKIGNKKYKKAKEEIGSKIYNLSEAIVVLKKIASAKFDETVELAAKLGVNPKYSDQMVRGTVVLPHGTGKSKKIAVISQGEKMKEAEEAGADEVGGEELIERMEKGWLGFDVLIATPDMMKSVAKLGRILGPRGLMPSPKTGTVTFELKQAISEVKAGKVEFKVDKGGVVHAGIGKISFEEGKLVENSLALIDAINRAKPPTAKGKYMKSLTLSTTMSPGVKIDLISLEKG